MSVYVIGKRKYQYKYYKNVKIGVYILQGSEDMRQTLGKGRHWEFSNTPRAETPKNRGTLQVAEGIKIICSNFSEVKKR